MGQYVEVEVAWASNLELWRPYSVSVLYNNCIAIRNLIKLLYMSEGPIALLALLLESECIVLTIFLCGSHGKIIFDTERLIVF